MFKKKDVITWRPWYLLRRYIKPTSVSALLCDPRTLHARCEFRQHYKPLLCKEVNIYLLTSTRWWLHLFALEYTFPEKLLSGCKHGEMSYFSEIFGCKCAPHLSNSLLKQGNGGRTFQSFFLFHFTLTVSIYSMLDTDILRSLLVINMPDKKSKLH